MLELTQHFNCTDLVLQVNSPIFQNTVNLLPANLDKMVLIMDVICRFITYQILNRTLTLTLTQLLNNPLFTCDIDFLMRWPIASFVHNCTHKNPWYWWLYLPPVGNISLLNHAGIHQMKSWNTPETLCVNHLWKYRYYTFQICGSCILLTSRPDIIPTSSPLRPKFHLACHVSTRHVWRLNVSSASRRVCWARRAVLVSAWQTTNKQ